MRRAALLCGLVALTMTAACSLEPDVGAPLVDRCSNVDSDPEVDVSYQLEIRPLIERASGGCLECHTPGGSNPVGVTVGGLDMSTLATLRAGGARSASNIILPGEPCSSTLFLKLTAAPFGSRMPADGPPFWTSDELQLLTDWIVEGAAAN